MFNVVALLALGILVGELLRRARQSREHENAWRRENFESLRRPRGSR